VETAPILKKLPIANLAESLLIRSTRHPRLQDLRADWLGVLEKISGNDILLADESQASIEAEAYS
jgi:hypothetical protein